jgi:predicted nucleotidyltransferase
MYRKVLIFGKPKYISENRKLAKAMYLDKILGSKTKVNALSVLVEHPERNIVENELAKEAGASVSEVNRQMKDLVNVGLVIMERVGKSKVYQVNQQHFLFEPLKSVFRGLEEIYREIASKVVRFVAGKYKVKTVLLFGSLASRRVRSDFVKEPSDVDILIVVKSKGQTEVVRKDVLDFVSSKIFPVYGINVYPIVLSIEEYISGLAKDAFIMDVHSRGEVLYGEKPRRFG